MTRAAATAYAISLAREHLGDYVPTADVTLTTSREPTTALGCGVRLVVTLTVVVDDPDEAAESQPVMPSGDFAIGDDRVGPEACECGAPFAPHPGAPGEHTRTCDCDDVEPDAPDDGGGQWERRQLGIDS